MSGEGRWQITLLDGHPVRVEIENGDTVIIMALRIHKSKCPMCGGFCMAVTPDNEDMDICWECEATMAEKFG